MSVAALYSRALKAVGLSSRKKQRHDLEPQVDYAAQAAFPFDPQLVGLDICVD